MNLSKQQEQIVKTEKTKVVVHSCAGSGKTRCLTERLKYLLDNGVDPSKIVAITFTNAAAEEIYERVGYTTNLFIGTIHSYANRLLLSSGVNTSDILNKEEFDKLFHRVKKNPHCIQEVEHLLLDEGQDSNPNQFEFLLEMINPKNWMIFCDVRQSIYRFAGAHPDYIFELMREFDVTTYELNENYRSAPEILNYARTIIRPLGIDYCDRSVSMREETRGRVLEVPYSSNGIAQTIQRYVNEGKATYADWFILTRTNAESEKIMAALKKHDIPHTTFKKANLDNKGLKEKMRENTVKVLTIHTAKGLEANNVIIIGARYRDKEERCISYVAATRAKNLLVWTTRPTPKRTRTVSWE